MVRLATLALTGLSLSLAGTAQAANVKFFDQSELPDLPTGGVIVYEGPVEKGDLQKVKLLIADNPECKTIAINSSGGHSLTGYDLAELIRKNGFNTETYGRGAWSAAAFMFWAGKKTTFVGEGATVGFHYAYNADDGQPAAQAAHALTGMSIYAGAPDYEGAKNLLIKMQMAFNAYGTGGFYVIKKDGDEYVTGYMNPSVSDRLIPEDEVRKLIND